MITIKDIKYWFTNKYWKVWEFFYYSSPIFIEIDFWNCWREWFQARKYFLKPAIEYRHTRYSQHGDDHYTLSGYNKGRRWFAIYVYCLDWKMKYDDPQFEYNPGFAITIGDHQFVWELHSPLITDRFDDLNYWESILNYLYGQWDRNNKKYIRSIKYAYNSHGWYDTQISEEDRKNKKYDNPISKTYYYIDEVLTEKAKKELTEQGVELHPGGKKIVYLTQKNS